MSLGKSLLKRLFRISLHHSVNAVSDFLNFSGAVRRLMISFPLKDTPQRNSNPKNSNFVFSSLRNRVKLMMLVSPAPVPVQIFLSALLLLDKIVPRLVCIGTHTRSHLHICRYSSCLCKTA